MAKRIPHVKAGDPITADLYNAVAERLERFLNLRSVSPYVRIWDTPTGKAMALAFPEPTYALLSGSSSPYSFTEVRDGPGGTWVSMPNGDSGTAYEVNSVPNLGGKVVPIEWTSASDWRFQWIGQGLACGLAVTVNGCLGFGVPGATVELRQSGTLIDSCVTDGRVSGVVRYNGGTGGTNGSYTNGTFTGGGGSGATFNYTVSGGVIQNTFTITNPGSGYTSVPTPVFPAGGTGVAANATLSSSCRLAPPAAGTYDLTVTPPTGTGFATYSGTVNFTCSGSTDMGTSVTLTPDTNHVCTIACNYPIPKTLYTTDGLGLHTLTLTSYNPVAKTGSWQETTTLSEPAFSRSPIGACSPDGSSVPVLYNLQCLSSAGNPVWFFTISWSAHCCDDGTYRYGSGPIGGGGTIGVSVPASADCYPLDLAFNVPTQDNTVCAFVTQHLATPGGGGLLEVTP